MEIEKEITVLVQSDYNKLKEILFKNNFKVKEEYVVKDDYFINSNLDIYSMNNLDVLKNCVLVREIVGIEKELLYKYKKYDSNGNIIEQGKVKCPVTKIDCAASFLGAIGYKKLFHIYDKCIVFVNDKTQLTVQLVNDKYIFIEIENHNEFISREYKDISEMKEDLLSYNLPIDSTNFFVKKAEIMLESIK